MDVKWVGKGLNEKLINNKNKKTIIKINPKFFRPAEVNILIGNPKKAKKELSWEPKTNINKLIKIMIDEEIKYYQGL
jgi:GDPmannose 4,6-dehydratase